MPQSGLWCYCMAVSLPLQRSVWERKVLRLGTSVSCAVRCFVEGKAPEMAPNLTTADTDSSFMREPVGCEPLTNRPGPCGGAWGGVSADPFFFDVVVLLFGFVQRTMIKSNDKIWTNKSD